MVGGSSVDMGIKLAGQSIDGTRLAPPWHCGRQYIDSMLSHLSAWLSAQVPSQCLVCRRWPAQPLCADCHGRFAHHPPRCSTCALVLAGSPTTDQCGACLRHPPPLTRCVAAVDYGYPWSLLITQWKFHTHPTLTRHLAAWLQQQPDWVGLRAQCSLTLPIPLSSQRLRQRGYQQALLLAQALDCPGIQADGLLRTRDTSAQSRHNRAERLRNLRGAFAVAPKLQPRLHGQAVLLVDDVITTGATLHAAAHAVLAAGAASVHAVALARTPQDAQR